MTSRYLGLSLSFKRTDQEEDLGAFDFLVHMGENRTFRLRLITAIPEAADMEFAKDPVMVKILSIVTGAPGNTGQVLITFQTIGILPEGIVHGQYAGWFDYGVLCEEIPKGMLEP